MAARLTIRIDFPGNRRVGPGRVRLLELIDETGSISAAGRATAMSYRRAWLFVDGLNASFRRAVVDTRSRRPARRRRPSDAVRARADRAPSDAGGRGGDGGQGARRRDRGGAGARRADPRAW
jgi:hypothetical protein